MSKVENYSKSIEIKKQQLESLEASVDAASKLFQNARAEYVEVLLAQRDLMDARMVLIETKKEQLSAIVNAYQALGGGGSWYATQGTVSIAEVNPAPAPPRRQRRNLSVRNENPRGRATSDGGCQANAQLDGGTIRSRSVVRRAPFRMLLLPSP